MCFFSTDNTDSEQITNNENTEGDIRKKRKYEVDTHGPIRLKNFYE